MTGYPALTTAIVVAILTNASANSIVGTWILEEVRSGEIAENVIRSELTFGDDAIVVTSTHYSDRAKPTESEGQYTLVHGVLAVEFSGGEIKVKCELVGGRLHFKDDDVHLVYRRKEEDAKEGAR